MSLARTIALGALLILCPLRAAAEEELAEASTADEEPPAERELPPPDEEAHDEARERFERGVELEQTGDLAGALVEYRRAHELRPAYRLRRHIGRACAGVGRYTEALGQYRLFLEEGGERVSEERRVEASAAIEELELRVARLDVAAPDGARVVVDSAMVGQTPLPAPHILDPGEHTVTIRARGRDEFTETIRISSGERHTVELPPELPPEPPPEPPQEPPQEGDTGPAEREEHPMPTPSFDGLSPVWFWASFGLTAALGIGVGVTGGLALAEQQTFDELNHRARTDGEDARLDEAAAAGAAYRLAADVMLFTGVAVALATAALAFVTDFTRGDAPAAVPSAGVSASSLTLGWELP